MRYTLGCSLSYNILSDTTFIFNLEVAKLKSVEILSESLVLTPNLRWHKVGFRVLREALPPPELSGD